MKNMVLSTYGGQKFWNSFNGVLLENVFPMVSGDQIPKWCNVEMATYVALNMFS